MHRLKRAIDQQTTLDPHRGPVGSRRGRRAPRRLGGPLPLRRARRGTGHGGRAGAHLGLEHPLGRRGCWPIPWAARARTWTPSCARRCARAWHGASRWSAATSSPAWSGSWTSSPARASPATSCWWRTSCRPRQGATPRICGRGSGAASLVSYALGLSNVDPVATNLMFERFLTKERKDPPDMDIDFAWDERDDVIQKVFERYGRDRVAMVANHAFFKAKGALRAVAQAHGRPDSELKQLARYVRGWEGGLVRAAENPAWDTILRQALALKGHFHQFSVHPGGTVVTPGPFWEHAAFQPAPAKDRRVHHHLGQGRRGELRPGEDRPAGQPQPRRHPRRLRGAGGPRARRSRHALPQRPRHPGPAGPGRQHRRLLRGEPRHAPAPAAGEEGRLRDAGDPQQPHPPRRLPLGGPLREAQPGRGGLGAQRSRVQRAAVRELRRAGLPGGRHQGLRGAGGLEPLRGRPAAQAPGQARLRGEAALLRGAVPQRLRGPRRAPRPRWTRPGT